MPFQSYKPPAPHAGVGHFNNLIALIKRSISRLLMVLSTAIRNTTKA